MELEVGLMALDGAAAGDLTRRDQVQEKHAGHDQPSNWKMSQLAV